MQENPETLPDTGSYEKYGKHYDEDSFWSKVGSLSRSAVAEVVEKALLLRELLLDSGAPLWVKASIVGALGYFILPLDMVPDLIPVAGYADDLAALALALGSLDHLVTDDIRQRALSRMPQSLRSASETPGNDPEPAPAEADDHDGAIPGFLGSPAAWFNIKDDEPT